MENAVNIEQLMQEGQPFKITLTTNASDEEKFFYLDVNSYDGSSGAFFENMMLWVSGVQVTPGAGETIESLRFDDKLVWSSVTADEALNLSGDVLLNSTSEPVGVAPSVVNKYGVKFLPVRNQFSLKNTTHVAPFLASTVVITGVYTRRTA